MDAGVVVISLVVLGGVGLLSGIMLAVASRVFAVKTDPRIEALANILPGGNCGGCGFPSCHAYAQNIVEGGAEPNRCVLGTDKADDIGKILGKEVATIESRVATIKCYGGNAAVKRFDYDGLPSCQAASLYGGGDRLCTHSCLGFGDCVEVCPFGALSREGRDAPRVDRDRCTGCGNCTKACPKAVIVLIPRKARIHVACNSEEKGKVVRQMCETGCISCNRCIKVCPEDALSMEGNRVHVDYNKCNNCGRCIEECPRKTIKDINPLDASRAVNQ